MRYADYLSIAEMNRWVLETDIDWDQVDPKLALTRPDILERLRGYALIESFFPIFTTRAMDLLWDDATATAIYSVQLYESYKHFHVFNLYLEAVNFHPITDAEIVEVRRRNLQLRYDNPARMLTRYMMSEHFAAHTFFKDSDSAPDPVLKQILHLVARDELRHCQFAYDLLAARLETHPGDAAAVLAEAAAFHHIGELVIGEVPVAEKNDFPAMFALKQKIQRLTGRCVGGQKVEAAA